MTLQTVSVDANGFRAALGNYASSVNVITMTDDDGRPLGMTATAFSSVSIDPLLILVCINRSTRTYQHIAARRVFGVNILGAVARDISDYCARAGADKNLDPRWLVQHSQWRAPRWAAPSPSSIARSSRTSPRGRTRCSSEPFAASA